jgi:hypothetical protein
LGSRSTLCHRHCARCTKPGFNDGANPHISPVSLASARARCCIDCKFAGFTPSVVRIHSYPSLSQSHSSSVQAVWRAIGHFISSERYYASCCSDRPRTQLPAAPRLQRAAGIGRARSNCKRYYPAQGAESVLQYLRRKSWHRPCARHGPRSQRFTGQWPVAPHQRAYRLSADPFCVIGNAAWQCAIE